MKFNTKMACKLIGILVMALGLPFSTQYILRRVPEDGPLNFSALAMKYGMASEEYDVNTEDGYILKLFHIPGDKSRPVLLMHGFLDSADTFVLRGLNSIASQLSKRGYDIWVGNYRGNKYCRRHIFLDPNTDPKFWDFSAHEHGIYDLSITIDFVLNKTNNDHLNMIAFSEGTMITYLLASIRPEYNQKIKVLISWAPISFLNNLVKSYPPIIKIGNILKFIFDSLHIEEVLAHDSVTAVITREVCSQSELGIDICKSALFYFAGFDSEGFESEFIPTIFWHFPAGTSKKNMVHLLQIISSRRFAQYDYGPAGNLAKYNSTRPPDYDLTKVTMKVALFTFENDKLSTLKDVSLLRGQLPNVESYKMFAKLNHVNSIWGRNAHEDLYPSTVHILDKYSNK